MKKEDGMFTQLMSLIFGYTLRQAGKGYNPQQWLFSYSYD